MIIYKILFFVLLNLSKIGLSLIATECEIPKYCEKSNMDIFFNKKHKYHIICSLKESEQLRFDINKKNKSIDLDRCLFTDIVSVKIKPDELFQSNVKLTRNSIDVKSLFQFLFTVLSYYDLEFDSIEGFDLQLFHESDITRKIKFNLIKSLKFFESSLRFYIGDKQMKSCQDFYSSAVNFSAPNSIFNIVNMLYEGNKHSNKPFFINLQNESKDKICPLVFKNVIMSKLYLNGVL